MKTFDDDMLHRAEAVLDGDADPAPGGPPLDDAAVAFAEAHRAARERFFVACESSAASTGDPATVGRLVALVRREALRERLTGVPTSLGSDGDPLATPLAFGTSVDESDEQDRGVTPAAAVRPTQRRASWATRIARRTRLAGTIAASLTLGYFGGWLYQQGATAPLTPTATPARVAPPNARIVSNPLLFDGIDLGRTAVVPATPGVVSAIGQQHPWVVSLYDATGRVLGTRSFATEVEARRFIREAQQQARTTTDLPTADVVANDGR